MKSKIGILGGTFDPPHHAHLIIANEARIKLGLEKVIFLPNAVPPHKQKSGLTSNADRLKMIELAIADNSFFEVDDREMHRSGKSYTYDTMIEMTKEFPNAAFSFIIGGDMVEYLPKWYHINELIKLVSFVGVNRPHYSEDSPYNIETIRVPAMDISSAMLRERLENGLPIDYYVPSQVSKYIKEHHLYE
ncbi:nicotinic acid mononucleotide adenylyltransferase [Listeria weihenstephanensis FSL R9-0317]|uniref:Probable nicotinate-nucleotide adenylyltransferase n=1 Tax=Listeria weihenstephanensis TaxID=1006155 RepID=A0A1S7FUT8_9LIST|nr:nicotinate-nucleotide adenylyltransferase [Listeria weihenstephanensis]AQY51208.1 nicotinate-nucleotide adenylyltransferase [Listeria weihenstephanensis]EUJ36860.1 nicotinic acid mononucleotide adenylyltransferase [Listeria weihenstephanensis FSL R9-0317]